MVAPVTMRSTTCNRKWIKWHLNKWRHFRRIFSRLQPHRCFHVKSDRDQRLSASRIPSKIRITTSLRARKWTDGKTLRDTDRQTVDVTTKLLSHRHIITVAQSSACCEYILFVCGLGAFFHPQQWAFLLYVEQLSASWEQSKRNSQSGSINNDARM